MLFLRQALPFKIPVQVYKIAICSTLSPAFTSISPLQLSRASGCTAVSYYGFTSHFLMCLLAIPILPLVSVYSSLWIVSFIWVFASTYS